MSKLLLLVVVGGVAVGAYNYSNGRDVFSLPGTSARALKNTVRDTVSSTVREARAEVKEHASEGVHTAVNRAEETSLAEGLRFERRLFHALFASEDQKEGMAAFLEKRPAQFRGR